MCIRDRGYTDLYDDVVRVIEINYPDKEISSSNDDGWSWNFLRNTKPKTN